MPLKTAIKGEGEGAWHSTTVVCVCDSHRTACSGKGNASPRSFCSTEQSQVSTRKTKGNKFM